MLANFIDKFHELEKLWYGRIGHYNLCKGHLLFYHLLKQTIMTSVVQNDLMNHVKRSSGLKYERVGSEQRLYFSYA